MASALVASLRGEGVRREVVELSPVPVEGVEPEAGAALPCWGCMDEPESVPERGERALVLSCCLSVLRALALGFWPGRR